jgi:hypothetical protein
VPKCNSHQLSNALCHVDRSDTCGSPLPRATPDGVTSTSSTLTPQPMLWEKTRNNLRHSDVMRTANLIGHLGPERANRLPTQRFPCQVPSTPISHIMSSQLLNSPWIPLLDPVVPLWFVLTAESSAVGSSN